MPVSSIIVDQPKPVLLLSSTLSSLTISWPAYSGASSYSITYSSLSASNEISSLTTLSTTIPCTEGEVLNIYYKALISSTYTPDSPSLSFICAPPPILTLTFTLNMKNLTLFWTLIDPYLIGCNIWSFTNDWDLLVSLPATINTYSLLTSGGDYKVGCYNLLGFTNQTISVSLPSQPDFTLSTNQILENITSLVSFNILADVLGLDGPSSEFVYALLELRDVCNITFGYECARVDMTNSYYIEDLLSSYIYWNISGSGTLKGEITVPFSGYYSMSIIGLQAGILGQFWDNIWFEGPFEVQYFKSFNISWNGVLAYYAKEFVSAKFFCFFTPKYTENYTISVKADDNFKLFINGDMIIDAWDSCCEEIEVFYYLVVGEYYYVQFEYRQLQTNAQIIMYWKSQSQSKQVIPEDVFFWPTRFMDSPWVQTVDQGLSKASLCYFTSENTVKAGYLSTINIYSVDFNGTVIDNPSDVFSIEFSSTIKMASIYKENGLSTLIFSLTQIGTYTVHIFLYGIEILNSPYTLTIIPGDLSPLKTTTSASSSSTYSVGVFNTITISPYDAYSNTLSSISDLSISLSLETPTLSTLSISPSDDWYSIYSQKIIIFSDLNIQFKVYISGTYSLSFFINSIILTNYPITITIQPSSIMPEHSLVIYSTTNLIAGDSFIANIQTQDNFYNNITSEITLTSSSFTSNYGNTGTVTISLGVITASIILTTSGSNVLTLKINDIEISMPTITVTANEILSYTHSEITKVTTSIVSGSIASFTIIAKDDYGNVRYNSNDSFEIIMNVDYEISDYLNGTYYVYFYPLIVGTHLINVQVETFDIKSSPVSIVVSNSNIMGYYSTLSVSSVTAGKGYFNIVSKDAGGNQITNPVRNKLMGKQYYFVTFQGLQSLTKNATFIDYSSYGVNFTELVKAGTYTAVLSLFEENGLIGFYYKDSSFLSMYQINSYFNHPNTSPSFYTQKDSQINFDWETGNPIINEAHIPSLFSIKWVGRLYIKYSETYTFIVTSDHRVRLTISGVILFDTITSKSSIIILSGSISLIGSCFYDFVLEYQNGGNFGRIFLQYSSTTESLKIIPSSSFYAQINSYLSPFTFNVVPAATSAAYCVVETGDDDLLEVGYSGKVKTFVILARDKYGNAQTGNDSFFAFVENLEVTVHVTGSAGVYYGTFTIDQIGNYKVKTYLNCASGAVLPSSSFTITIYPGEIKPINTILTGIQNLDAESWGSFSVKLYDQANNALTSGGYSVTIEILTLNTTVPSGQILIIDNKDGSYTGTFIIFIADIYNFTLYVEEILVTNLQFEVFPLPEENTISSRI